MATKKELKKQHRELKESNASNPAFKRAEYELSKMKMRDIQRACVARGIDFELMLSMGLPELSGWFCSHYDWSQDLNLLNSYDDWKELQLKVKHPDKTDPVYHPSLRLGFVARKDDEGNVTETKKPRLKGLEKKAKKKKEKLEGTNVFSGTKKAMTYQLATQHKSKEKLPALTVEQVWEQVEKQFPEAQLKSVKIWYKRARNGK